MKWIDERIRLSRPPRHPRPVSAMAARQWRCLVASALLIYFHTTNSGWLTTPCHAQGGYGPAEHRGNLENQNIIESSGLARSLNQPGLLWTHNDSGAVAELFAFDLSGRHRGVCRLKGVQPLDWEDMGSFRLAGRHFLFVADVGDNLRKRDTCTLLIVAEPTRLDSEIASRSIIFRYEGGPRDCEAVAYDAARREFLLVEKQLGLTAGVYSFSWPAPVDEPVKIARPIGRIPVPLATGMDITDEGTRLVIVTYGPGVIYERGAQEDWAQAFRRTPQALNLPARRQGESVCFAADQATLLLTSEKKPCPLFSVPPRKLSPPP